MKRKLERVETELSPRRPQGAKDECKPLKPARLRFKRCKRNEIFALLCSAFDPDGITPAEPFLQFIDRKAQSAGPADHGAVLAAVSEFVGITARTGVEEGNDLVVQLEYEETDVLAVILISVKLRYFRFEL